MDIPGVPDITFSGRDFVHDCATLFSGKNIWDRSSSVLPARRAQDFCSGSRYLRLVCISYATFYFWPNMAVGFCVAVINGSSRHTGQPNPRAYFSVVCDNCDGGSSHLARFVERHRKLTDRS